MIAGQGTVGLEIADEVAPDVVIVPVGGGGLIAGIAAALALRAPNAEVIGVEAAGSPQLSASLAADAAASIGRPSTPLLTVWPPAASVRFRSR